MDASRRRCVRLRRRSYLPLIRSPPPLQQHFFLFLYPFLMKPLVLYFVLCVFLSLSMVTWLTCGENLL